MISIENWKIQDMMNKLLFMEMKFKKKLEKSNFFMVGAGATGCEFLINFAIMGSYSDKNCKFINTENDNIEISNLSRQFLFKNNDVGKSKSE